MKFTTSFIFLALFFAFPRFSYADVDIKLNCRLTITVNFRNGAVDKDTKNVITEVYQNNNLLTIVFNSDLQSVASVKSPSVVYVNNLSDSNKWELENVSSREGNNMQTSVQIDRNSGVLTYHSDFNKGRAVTDANGICEKIDTSKKKF
jgi:hypothetical protein